MGEVGEDGVGGVEIGVVLDGVDGAEEKDEREDYEGSLSGVDADRHHSRGTNATTATATLERFHVIRFG